MDIFAKWIESNYANFDLKVNELTWIQSYFPEYFDVEASIVVNERKHFGRGQSNISKEMAVAKAVTEALERAVFLETDRNLRNEVDSSAIDNVEEEFTTSGLALHPNEEKAIISAAMELIERDLFFCHYLTETTFLDVSEDQVYQNTLYGRVKEKLLSQNIELKLGQFLSTPNFSCYLCVAFGDSAEEDMRFGAIIGMACAQSLKDAVDKAVLECIPNVLAHINGSHTKKYSIGEFCNLTKVHPLDHLALAKNLDNVKYLRSLFAKNESMVKGIDIDVDTFFENMIIKNIELPLWGKDCGLIAMRAYNPLLQKIFFGVTRKELINFNRLKQFCGRDIDYKDIHQYPHPFP